MEGTRDARGRLLADARTRAMAHPTRRRLMEEMALSGQRSVPELADALRIERANLYHHLDALQGAGLIARSGRGRQRVYGPIDAAMPASRAPVAREALAAGVVSPIARSVRIECDATILVDVVRSLRERFDVDERAGTLRLRPRAPPSVADEEAQGPGS